MIDNAYLANRLPDISVFMYGMEMTLEEIRSRRNYIREKLRGTYYEDLPEDELDKCRYFEPEGSNICMFFDSKGRPICLSKSINRDPGFRKDRSRMPFENMDKGVKDFKFDAYGQGNEVISAVKRILNNYLINFKDNMYDAGMGLYIHSNAYGTGKTLLACCVLNWIIERCPWLSIKFICVSDLLDIKKNGFNEGNGLSGVQEANVLVIDDLGAQGSKQWINDTIREMIIYRYNLKKVTIYTSAYAINNLKLDERTKRIIAKVNYDITLPDISIGDKLAAEERDRLLNGRK